MLKRVSIQNFKSLKDVTLDLQKVNLLIGPNNSGKTNFLKALEYFGRDVKLHSTETDRNRIAYKRNAQDIIKVDFKFDTDKHNFDDIGYEYQVFGCQINPNGTVMRSNSYEDLTQPGITIISTKESLFEQEVFKQKSGPLIIYKPDPNKLTQPGPVGTGAETVNADASNLVGFLDLMLGKYRRPVFNRTEKDLQTCIPEFDEINLEDAPPTDELKKEFGDKSFKKIGLTNSHQGVTYWADELSEGTLYFLALLCIINQPNPPKLLLLEEPEKGIHPRRIFEVIQFILRLSEEKDVQIIMTTHSPIVVDMFKDMPESVFIFDKDDEGATHVKNLQRDVIELETQKSKELGIESPHYTDSLGDAWVVGFLGGVPK
jgi:predicted ATPase